VELVFCVDGLRSGYQIFTKSVAEVNIDFIEAALIVAESGKVFIDVPPLAVLLVGLLLEVVKETATEFVAVKEVVSFVYNALESVATNGFCFLSHGLIVKFLTLILWLGIDVDAERFMSHDLHC